MGKSFIDCLKQDLDEKYCANMPSCQFGAIKGGGTDLAHHLVLTALDYAAAMSYSIFVLFVDLVKAFDKVLRELVMGFSHHPAGDRVEYLCSVRLSHSDAEWMCCYIDEHGTAFELWDVNKKWLL